MKPAPLNFLIHALRQKTAGYTEENFWPKGYRRNKNAFINVIPSGENENDFLGTFPRFTLWPKQLVAERGEIEGNFATRTSWSVSVTAKRNKHLVTVIYSPLHVSVFLIIITLNVHVCFIWDKSFNKSFVVNVFMTAQKSFLLFLDVVN